MNKEEFLENIKKVIKTGEGWKDKSAHLPVRNAINWLEEIGIIEADDSFESNGWSWDWWTTLTFDGKNYFLSGSGYDGGLSFELIKD